jgi:hypothetical protein
VDMVPRAGDDMVVLDAVVGVVPPIMDAESVLDIIDGGDRDGIVMEGGGGAGVAGVVGCPDRPRYGATPLLVPDAEEAAGTLDIVGATVGDGNEPIVPPVADMDVTGTAGAPGVICPAVVVGCPDSVRYGAIPLLVPEEEAAGTPDIVGAAADGIGSIVPPIADMDVTATAGVLGVICPAGVEQVATVPGVVGSEASGTGARVVSGVPGCVAAENGPGP